MDILEAMHARHSVRQYTTQPLSAAKVQHLQEEIDTCNREIRLYIQLIKDELKTVQGFLDHDEKLQYMRNDVAMIETKEMKSEEICGYHRERFVLLAQQIDLNFCRTALTCRKSKRTSAVKKVSKQRMRRTREGCA